MNNNTIVITAEQAEGLSRRNSLLNKQLDEISQNYESRQKQLNGTSSDVVREVESSSSLVPNNSIITLPLQAAHCVASWWGNYPVGTAAARSVLRRRNLRCVKLSRTWQVARVAAR